MIDVLDDAATKYGFFRRASVDWNVATWNILIKMCFCFELPEWCFPLNEYRVELQRCKSSGFCYLCGGYDAHASGCWMSSSSEFGEWDDEKTDPGIGQLEKKCSNCGNSDGTHWTWCPNWRKYE